MNKTKLKTIKWYQITNYHVVCVSKCVSRSKNIQRRHSGRNRLAQTSSIWIWSNQYIWSHCIFMLDCLAWHLSADNLWHIWCQSAITFLIKGPQIMNIFFRWQEMLVMSRGLDLWSLSFSQLTGYLGTNQCVSERVSEFIYLGVSPRPALWPSVGHMQHHNGNQGNSINWGGGEKRKNITCELLLLQ